MLSIISINFVVRKSCDCDTSHELLLMARNSTWALVLLILNACIESTAEPTAGGLQVWACGVLVFQRLQCAKAPSEDCGRRACHKGACSALFLSLL